LSLKKEIKAMNNPVIDEFKTERWYNKKGEFHRVGGPAVIYKHGGCVKMWYRKGELHRTDGPAVTYKDGEEQWFIHGNPIDPIPNIVLYLRKKLKQ